MCKNWNNVSCFWTNKKNEIQSGEDDLNQTYFNDPDIVEKIDMTKPVSFLIHGWLGGLNGGNMYLPYEVKPKKGMREKLYCPS